jgi:hypothetical protein
MLPAFFAGIVVSPERQDVAGLTLQRHGNLFQRIESYTLGFTLLQAPQRRMTDAGLFGQPVERPLLFFEDLIDSDFDHYDIRSLSAWFGLPGLACVLFITDAQYVSTEYIAFLTYTVP